MSPFRGRIQGHGPYQGAWLTQERRYFFLEVHSLSSHLSLSNSSYMKVSVTVKREFMEEALDSTGAAKVYYRLIRIPFK